jgi:hypothetical protein
MGLEHSSIPNKECEASMRSETATRSAATVGRRSTHAHARLRRGRAAHRDVAGLAVDQEGRVFLIC